MKQTLTLITACLLMLMTFTVKAQDTDDADETKPVVKSYISLLGGISYPLSDFANRNYNNYKSGFAKRGFTWGFDGAVHVKNNFSVGYLVSYQDQGNITYDDDVILSTGYTADYKADGSTVTTNKRYKSFNFLLGPQYSFLYHRFSLDLRAMVGAVKNIATPTVEVTIDGVSSQTTAIEQASAKSFAFAYGGSAGIRFDMGAGWGLSLKGNYIESKGPNIKTTGRTDAVGRIVTKQPMTEGQLLFGLVKEF